MHVKRLSLTNFRNYEHSSVSFNGGRNLLIGENAQGKTNLLEAIEIISTGKSSRAQQDSDLIRNGQEQMSIELLFDSQGAESSASLSFRAPKAVGGSRLEKQIKLNGVTLGSARALRGRLAVVSFRSSDLNLLRGGPKYRREWIDDILITLRPVYQQTLSKYQKIVSQRNRLLKTLFERARLTVSDQDELRVWDEQVAKTGAQIIKLRMVLLHELLPIAERHQEFLSGHRERLSAMYMWRAPDLDDDLAVNPYLQTEEAPADQIIQQSEIEIVSALLKLMKQRRGEEIARKQTLCGPHRDDIRFCLNALSAVEFASQGQQRSLVLAFKLAELDRVKESVNESPVLLLDDVLAELDLNRQGLLMQLVNSDTQTLISTTHLTGFRPEWLEGALFLEVVGGSVSPIREPQAVL